MGFLGEKVIDMAIDAVLEASGIKDKVNRNQHVIRLLQKLGLDDLESLTAFEDIYAYAVVEYAFDEQGQCKPEPLVRFFKTKAVRDLFQAAYQDNDPKGWLRKGEEIAQFELANQLPNIDPKRELATFAAVFLRILKQTRSPKEIRQEQKLDSLQRHLQQIQTQIQQLPSLEAIHQQVSQLAGSETLALPPAAQTSDAAELAQQLGEWFDVLDYDRDPDYEVWTEDYFEWIINFPLTRRKFSRILVRGIAGEVEMGDLQRFQQQVVDAQTDEGWLVGNRRVSKAARNAEKTEETYADITCYTLDELLDEDADFSKYLNWLGAEIKTKGIDQGYIPLACSKDELDPVSQQKIGRSVYGEEDGWIDGYVDQWLDDPSKEHLSILGEFGTGKTWFTLHYAWVALQRYQAAKQKGLERPRVPIVVPLRDYAKAVTVESLFSEFFFRKHEILKSYSVFEQLNRMGKLLLIFDGFDEMAARVNRQAMIDNFWELAKVVVPGAKAILTCRTEHFPDAIEGRRLLGAELKASTANLTGEPPQFEVLDLAKFDDDQIAELLGRKAQATTVETVMGNAQLLDLARRPVMVDLILEALPDIEAGKPIDMARVYLYAVTHKMERDITSDRTFTSLADKLYFLCELSWEMLSTDRMSLNYRAFPERLQRLFADRVKEEQELDHWRYDMLGQTMLIRNSGGDYSPAHRSLLEFFVAYKLVASLGVLAPDFTEVAQNQSHLKETAAHPYTWESYFKRSCDGEGTPEAMAPLARFAPLAFEDLLPLLSHSKLAKAVLDLAHPMVDGAAMRDTLLPLLWATREHTLNTVGYLGGNIAQLMLARRPHALANSDLSRVKLRGTDFARTYLQRINWQWAQLAEATFSKVLAFVNTVAFNPGGDRLAIGDSQGTVQVWDVATGQVIWLQSGHQSEVNSVAFSPDGATLASGSNDKTVKLWSRQSGDCLNTLEGHQNRVMSVAFSPDGATLASASGDKTVKLWSRQSGDCLNTLKGHQDGVMSVAFSPDGATLASASGDKTVKLWSRQSGDCLNTLKGHQNVVLSVAFSPDGATLASASGDKTVKLWSRQSGDCLNTLKGHQDVVLSVAFSLDGATLASASGDKTVKLWSRQSGDCLNTLKGHQDGVMSVAFSPDGATLASASGDKTVKLWSRQSGDCLNTLKGHQNVVLSVAFSPDGATLASASGDKTVKLWSRQSGGCLNTLEGHQNWVMSVAFSPDGATLVSGSNDKTVKLWSRQSGDCLNTLKGHQNWVRSVAFSPDGATLVSASYDKTVKLWSSPSGGCLNTLEGHQNRVRSVAFSPDGATLASASYDKTVKLWSSPSGDCLNTLKGHQDGVMSVAFSPDGATLASGSGDKTVRLWSSPSGDCLNTLEGHQDGVMSVAFSPDGATLASASGDKTVRLWSSPSGDCLNTLEGHQNWVMSVAFSPDGATLASASYDETLRLWDVKTGECLRVIDDRVCSGMDITGVVGLTAGQRTALKLLGAIDLNQP
jgi:WD40 repeat protein